MDIPRLGRLHTALVTAAIPLMAFVASGGEWISGLLIVIGAIMHHGWGFSLNEIMDLEIDRKNPALSSKPLISGAVSKSEAHIISGSFLLISFIMFSLAGYLSSGGVLLTMIFLAGSTFCGAIYDIWGKRFPLSDIFMAGWMFLLVMAAGSTIGYDPLSSNAIMAIAVLGGLQILFNNSVEGGLKDVRNDREAGTRTLAVISGALLTERGLRPGKVIGWWGICLRTATILISASMSYLIAEEEGWGMWIVISTTMIGIVVFVHSMRFLTNRPGISRKELISTFAKHEMISFVLVMVTVLPAVGIIPAILIFITPFIWFGIMNKLLFGTRITPGV